MSNDTLAKSFYRVQKSFYRPVGHWNPCDLFIKRGYVTRSSFFALDNHVNQFFSRVSFPSQSPFIAYFNLFPSRLLSFLCAYMSIPMYLASSWFGEWHRFVCKVDNVAVVLVVADSDPCPRGERGAEPTEREAGHVVNRCHHV